MTYDYVIGVDCSTTAAKAVVWNARGEALSQDRRTFELSQPRPGWGEQNAEDWWTATAGAVRLLEAAHPRHRRRVCRGHTGGHDGVVTDDEVGAGVAVQDVPGVRPADTGRGLLERATDELVLARVAVDGV